MVTFFVFVFKKLMLPFKHLKTLFRFNVLLFNFLYICHHCHLSFSSTESPCQCTLQCLVFLRLLKAAELARCVAMCRGERKVIIFQPVGETFFQLTTLSIINAYQTMKTKTVICRFINKGGKFVNSVNNKNIFCLNNGKKKNETES